jgi:F-type H+-transporting ATPase subunit a
VAKKKGCLGCSLPVAILVIVIFVGIMTVGLLAGPLGRTFGIEGLPGWMTLHLPEPKLPADVVFHIGTFGVTNTLLASWVTMIFLVLVAFLVARKPKLIPGRVQSMIESILGYIHDLCTGTAGERDGRRFFPLVATIFLFVLFNALLALIPGFGSLELHTHEGEMVEVLRGANTDFNTPLMLATVTFITFLFMGFKRLGFGYMKNYLTWGEFGRAFGKIFKGKFDVMGLLSGFIMGIVGILEFISMLIRLVSLTFRLFGNMLAGEIILIVIAYVVPYFIPLIFYGLESFFAVIQALIFAALTIVYISLSVTPHGGEEHGHKAAAH